MEEARFWDLVELAKWPCDYEKMKIKYLKILTAVECKAFRKTLSAAFSMLNGVYSGVDLCVSDDNYSNLLNHIIGKGKEFYYKAINDTKIGIDLALTRNYTESFSYCVPYDDDYGELGRYSMSAVINIAKSARKEIKYMRDLDKGSDYLQPIHKELSMLDQILASFLKKSVLTDIARLEDLVSFKKHFEKACAKIDKFFEKNYLELPKKFTNERENGSDFNGMCTAVITNTVYDAETVLEFLT